MDKTIKIEYKLDWKWYWNFFPLIYLSRLSQLSPLHGWGSLKHNHVGYATVLRDGQIEFGLADLLFIDKIKFQQYF